MFEVLPSTFKRLDQAFPVIDDRRTSVALVGHFSIPLTILADMVTGIAHLVFLGVRLELTEKKFWNISHEHFFVYPFQQFVYFLFASLETLWSGSYFNGYRLGQWAVINLSNETYRGPPQIFSHVIESYERPQFFPDITLSEHDRQKLQELVEHTNLFKSHVDEIEGEHEIKNITYIYQVFYSERPLSLHRLDEIYEKKRLANASCGVRNALSEAKLALEAFFALPRVVQVRLVPHL